jgi:hypothetical protein
VAVAVRIEAANTPTTVGVGPDVQRVGARSSLALTGFEASESYATAASELAAGTLGKDRKLLSAMVACGAK